MWQFDAVATAVALTALAMAHHQACSRAGARAAKRPVSRGTGAGATRVRVTGPALFCLCVVFVCGGAEGGQMLQYVGRLGEGGTTFRKGQENDSLQMTQSLDAFKKENRKNIVKDSIIS